MPPKTTDGPPQARIHYQGAAALTLHVTHEPLTFQPDTTREVDAALVPVLLAMRDPKTKRLLFVEPPAGRVKASTPEGDPDA